MKINDTKVFKHQFWLLRDGGVMLITDIREGEPHPILGVRAVYDEGPATELSWASSGKIMGEGELANWDMIERLTAFQMGHLIEATHEPNPAADFERDSFEGAA